MSAFECRAARLPHRFRLATAIAILFKLIFVQLDSESRLFRDLRGRRAELEGPTQQVSLVIQRPNEIARIALAGNRWQRGSDRARN